MTLFRAPQVIQGHSEQTIWLSAGDSAGVMDQYRLVCESNYCHKELCCQPTSQQGSLGPSQPEKYLCGERNASMLCWCQCVGWNVRAAETGVAIGILINRGPPLTHMKQHSSSYKLSQREQFGTGYNMA